VFDGLLIVEEKANFALGGRGNILFGGGCDLAE